MTYRTLEDGTRVYPKGLRYKPKTPAERKYGVNKPDDPTAVRYGARWFIPIEFLAEDQRDMPETIPDDETLLHSGACQCVPCKRPQAPGVWRRWRQSHSLKPIVPPRS